MGFIAEMDSPLHDDPAAQGIPYPSNVNGCPTVYHKSTLPRVQKIHNPTENEVGHSHFHVYTVLQ